MFGVIARYVRRHHVALLALFVALGGTAAAATFINGTSIKPRSIPENRLTPQAAASLKASNLRVYCAAAKAKPASYPSAPCRARSETAATGASGLWGMAIGTDGNPVLPQGAHPITLIRCNDPLCAGGDEPSQEINGTFCGRAAADVAINSEGNPIVSQWNGGCVSNEGWLNVSSCFDPSCAGNEGGPTFDIEGTGSYNSIAIGADGNPVVSYYDAVNGDLKVLHCNDPICAGDDETLSAVDSDPATDVGWFTSIAIGADGKPVIAYYDATNADLKVARCNDVACAGGNETLSAVDSPGLLGKYASLAIGTDGNPVIAYYDEGNADLKVARCNDKSCAGGNEKRTSVDTSGDVGTWASVAIGIDGRPVVAYYDATNADLKLARCNDAACAGANERLETLDRTGDVGARASLAIGVDGVPTVAYVDATNNALKVARPSIP
jgi:hypothetical protein